MWGAVANQSTGDSRTLQLNQIPIIKKKKIVIYCFFVWRQTSRLLSMKWINYKHGCADDLRKILKFQNKKKTKQLKMFSPQSRHAHTNFHAVQNWSQNICRSAAILPLWCHLHTLTNQKQGIRTILQSATRGRVQMFWLPFCKFQKHLHLQSGV